MPTDKIPTRLRWEEVSIVNFLGMGEMAVHIDLYQHRIEYFNQLEWLW